MSPDGLKKELLWKTVALGLFGGRRNGTRDGLGMARGSVFMGALGLALVGATFGGQEVFATASSLTLSVSGNPTINLPPSAEGKFADSGDQTISVSTTHAAGYVLKIKASDATTLKNTSGTVGFTSISSAISEETFDTSDYNGKWGYKPSKLNGTENTNYLPSPTTTGSTIDSVSSATNNSYTVSIGARADINTAIDNYSNTFVFTVTANPTPYTITYNANTTDTVSNMPSNVDSTTSGNVTIANNTPTRDGYNFQGWCTAQVADGASCTGVSYAAGETFEIDQTATSNTLTLYAVWHQPYCLNPVNKDSVYCKVANQSKGKNTDSSSGFSWTSITAETSGVYEWDGKTAGNGTDSNGGDQEIYFYRGILDNTTGSYGSDGDAGAYPNYVILQSGSDKATTDTCWRIVRTTSTGGVKLIYNGLYGATTTGSCANATTKAQTTTSAFNTSSTTVAGKSYTGLQYQNIHAVGYTYASSVAASTTTTKTPAQLFGASGNDTTTNDKSSIIKQYIEDWYASTLTDYTSILEGDAGYCQDRRLNTSTTWTTALSESSNTIVPYGTSGLTTYYFGAYPRNTQSSTFNPLLTCPRGKVDLYSYSGDAGNGNGQLQYPVALLTADEATMAGSGWGSSTGAYNSNSYLRSGSDFWLLSPYYRYSRGLAYGFILYSRGNLSVNYVNNAYGVRPAISLSPGTEATSGSGTATDPWVVIAP